MAGMIRTSLRVIGPLDENIAWQLYEGKSVEAIAKTMCWTPHRLHRRLRTNWKIKFYLNELWGEKGTLIDYPSK